MRRSVVFMAVWFVSVLICSTILSADFCVIPAGKKNAAPVGKTGQTSCHNADGSRVDCAGTGQDGDVRAGVSWPVPRFTDNGNGTVTGHLTGLIWTKVLGRNVGNRETLPDFCSGLASGTCGLADGSGAGDWRLANHNELTSLVDAGRSDPAVPGGHPFTGALSVAFLSSTTASCMTPRAWLVSQHSGIPGTGPKTGGWYGACVRGGR